MTKENIKEYDFLVNLVTDFDGDVISSTYKYELVKQVADNNETVLFMTNTGKLFSVYKTKLIKQ